MSCSEDIQYLKHFGWCDRFMNLLQLPGSLSDDVQIVKSKQVHINVVSDFFYSNVLCSKPLQKHMDDEL